MAKRALRVWVEHENDHRGHCDRAGTTAGCQAAEPQHRHQANELGGED
jgi:hypothetical protein